MQTLRDILIVVAALLALVSIADVFRHGLDRGRVAAWVLIIAIVPVAGSVLYWILRLTGTRDPGRHRQSPARARRLE